MGRFGLDCDFFKPGRAQRAKKPQDLRVGRRQNCFLCIFSNDEVKKKNLNNIWKSTVFHFVYSCFL